MLARRALVLLLFGAILDAPLVIFAQSNLSTILVTSNDTTTVGPTTKPSTKLTTKFSLPVTTPPQSKSLFCNFRQDLDDNSDEIPPNCVRHSCSASSKADLEACGYSIRWPSSLFDLGECDRKVEPHGPIPDHLCIKPMGGSPAKLGRVEIETKMPISATGPHCRLLIRLIVASPDFGTKSSIGSWNVFVQPQGRADKPQLVGSLYGSMVTEGLDFMMEVSLPNLSNSTILITADQMSNFTGIKAISHLIFDSCAQPPTSQTIVKKTDDLFRCSNGLDVPWNVTCDFVDDCGDGSDSRPSSDESDDTVGCSFLTTRCILPASCDAALGWDILGGRILPSFNPSTSYLLPDPPKSAVPKFSSKNLTAGFIDLTSQFSQHDDAFTFQLPAIDTRRDLVNFNDAKSDCFLRFHYATPVGIDVDFQVVDSLHSTILARLDNVAAVGATWSRAIIRISPDSNASISSVRPAIMIRPKRQILFQSNPSYRIASNGIIGIWGLSFSSGCRIINGNPDDSGQDFMAEIGTLTCKKGELACNRPQFGAYRHFDILEQLTNPEDYGRGVCYAPKQKCDFVCDCFDCSDELACGSSCTFDRPGASCGWSTDDNWLWPPPTGNICSGSQCIISVPDSITTSAKVSTVKPKDRAIWSGIYEQASAHCSVSFSYRLWPGTGLQLVLKEATGNQTIWQRVLPIATKSALDWQQQSVQLSEGNKTLEHFQLAFIPLLSQSAADVPIGLSEITFDDHNCSTKNPVDYPKCPTSGLEIDGAAEGPIQNIETAVTRGCSQDLCINCMDPDPLAGCSKARNNTHSHSKVCRLIQPVDVDGIFHAELAGLGEIHVTKRNITTSTGTISVEPSKTTARSLVEIIDFPSASDFCAMSSCFIFVRLTISLNQPSSGAYVGLSLEQVEEATTDKSSVRKVRHSQLWKHWLTAQSYPHEYFNFVKVPVNYCPPPVNQTEESQRVRTSGRVFLEQVIDVGAAQIKVDRLIMSEGCAIGGVIRNGFYPESSCPLSHEVRCNDNRCLPKSMVCGTNSPSGLECNCQSLSSKPKVIPSPRYSGFKIGLIVFAALLCFVLVSAIVVTMTRRILKWYNRGGAGVRPIPYRRHRLTGSSVDEGAADDMMRQGVQSGAPKEVTDRSTQLMLDMLVTDEESNW